MRTEECNKGWEDLRGIAHVHHDTHISHFKKLSKLIF